MAKPPKEPPNQYAANIDHAERAFAEALKTVARISLADAERVSVHYRRKNIARLNDRANTIVVDDPKWLFPAAIKQTLKELNSRD